ncbi:MAG: hypothetical protein ACLFTX_06525 [Thiohalospira sp.]
MSDLTARALDLLAGGESWTTEELATALGERQGDVQTVVAMLYIEHKALAILVRDGRPRWYAPERVGRCEWCGRVDHHLLGGQCPACAERVTEAV